MPTNPYVRAIKLFNPSVDLAVDDVQDPRRRVRNRRPPVNPAEGLLDDEDDSPSAEVANEPAPRRAAEPRGASAPASRPTPASAADDGMSVSADGDFESGPDATGAGEDAGDAQTERFQGGTLGEVPDAIDADLAAEFPEPVDL